MAEESEESEQEQNQSQEPDLSTWLENGVQGTLLKKERDLKHLETKDLGEFETK